MVALVATILVGWPLLGDAIPIGHDTYAYPPRIAEWLASARAMEWPRWASGLSAGHGQPLFVFVPPLFHALSAAWFVATGDLGLAINSSLVTLLFVGTLAIAATARASGADGIIAAISFATSPWILADLYVRAAFAELSALCVFPIALFGLTSKQRAPLAAIGVALVMLAHFPSALILAPLYLGFAVARALDEGSFELVIRALLLGALGLACAAFVWAPPIMLASSVHLDRAASHYTDFRLHFLEPVQLLVGEWGHGLSVEGPDDGMSFALSSVSVVAAVLALRRGSRGTVVLAGLALAAAFLTTGASSLFWESLPLLPRVQFPWRFLGPASIALVLVASRLPERFESPGWRAVVRVGLVAALLATALPHALPFRTEPVDLLDLSPEQLARNDVAATIAEEFEPAAVTERAEPWDGIAELRTGAASIRLLARTPNTLKVEVDAAAASTVALGVHDFPVWALEGSIHGVELGVEARSGLVTVSVPKGRHQLALRLEPTTGELALRAASFAAFVALVAWARRARSRLRPPE